MNNHEFMMDKTKNPELKIAVVNVSNRDKNVAMNKDLNGGFGTADSYSGTVFERIISFIKRRSIKLPIISLAYLMGVLKQRKIHARYYEGSLPSRNDDFKVFLVYGSIVDFRNENRVAKNLKGQNPQAKVGFIGPFPSTMPELFGSCDFVIRGNFEKFFMHDFKELSQLEGIVDVRGEFDKDSLPSPELEGFPISEYSYSPAIAAKPFFALQASWGCPYSCSYYCVYGKFQGSKVFFRSPKKVIDDIMHLKTKYGIKGVQFRDPAFGIRKGYIEKLCREMRKRKVDIEWGIETRADLLDKNKIKMMFGVGLRNINIGIETIDPELANKNRRVLSNVKHQEELIRYCNEIGVKISAFYLFGYENDSVESMRRTLEYAKKLNTFLARFAICTPYPGTKYYEDMKREKRLLTDDFEKYTQFNPIIRHDNLSPGKTRQMLATAYRQYYFRPSYILMVLRWKIREFLS